MDALTGWLDVSAVAFVVLTAAALLVGFAKTAVGGLGLVSASLFAAVLPARASTGALLPLLIAGDVFAVASYRQHADWKVLVRLFPAVGVGVALGAFFVSRVDDTVMRRTIGAVLLLLVVLTVVIGRREDLAAAHAGRTASASYGAGAGFTTMVANAGGPVMSLYLLSSGFSVLGFLGTSSWFFFLVNLFKLPFSVGLGLISSHSLVVDAVLLPGVVVGALLGRWLIGRISRRVFEVLVLVTTALSAAYLLVR